MAALLHDTVEETHMMLDYIKVKYGEAVDDIVDGLTYMVSNDEVFSKIQITSLENVIQYLGVKEKLSIYVTISVRLHNIRSLKIKSRKSQILKAEETQTVFIPHVKKWEIHKPKRNLKKYMMKYLLKTIINLQRRSKK